MDGKFYKLRLASRKILFGSNNTNDLNNINGSIAYSQGK
jgi:hypothetical protein